MRLSILGAAFFAAAVVCPTLAAADCQVAIVDSQVGAAQRLRIMGLNGRLPRFVSLQGAAVRVAASHQPDAKLFMAETTPSRITRTDLDGSNYTTIVDRTLTPLTVAVYQDFLYWTEDTSDPVDQGQGAIVRSKFDGSNIEVVVSGLSNPNGLTFDNSGRMYWTIAKLNPQGGDDIGEVYVANADGSGAHRILDLNAIAVANHIGSVSHPKSLAIDDIHGLLFVSDLEDDSSVFVPGVIWQSKLDGTEPQIFKRTFGCIGSANCVPQVTSDVAFDDDSDSLYISYRDTDVSFLVGFDVITKAGKTASLAAGTGIALLGADQGLCSASGDLTGSVHRNFTVWRPSTGTWFEKENSANPNLSTRQWGLPTDIPLLGNLNGDSLSDLAVWRPALGTWFLCDWDGAGNCRATETFQWGLPGDIPVLADFDGDSLDDIGVWRPSTGTWLTRPTGTAVSRQWGLPGDLPMTGDFNSDGKADYVVWRPSTGTWYILYSSFTGSQPDGSVTVTRQWGLPGDRPLIDDYDGDGKPDLAVWRPSTGTWYICPSLSGYDCVNQGISKQFGLPGDIPVGGDFDGDGKADVAVWRPSSGDWFYFGSSTQQQFSQQWGLPEDVPLGRTVFQESLGK